MNEKILILLKNIAILLQIKGENAFKSNAYNTAADIIETQNLDIQNLVKNNSLSNVNGFGKALTEKITEYVQTGKLDYYQNLINEIPESLIELTKLDGLGTKKIKILFDQLNIKNINDLKQSLEDGKIAELKGFGKKSEQNLKDQLS